MEPKHIMVVEDEPAAMKFIATALTTAGYRVTTALGGAAAISAARKDRPDLAVIDLLMPGIDGYQLCSMFRRDRTCNFPILVISGRTREGDAQRALDSGAARFLAKPFSDRQLLDCVARLLAP